MKQDAQMALLPLFWPIPKAETNTMADQYSQVLWLR